MNIKKIIVEFLKISFSILFKVNIKKKIKIIKIFIKEIDDPKIIDRGIKENKKIYIFSILLFVINFIL